MPERIRTVASSGLAVLLGSLVIGCARPHPKAPPAPPALDMPAPPPHDMAPAAIEMSPPAELVLEPPHTPPPPPRRSQPPVKTEAPKPEPTPEQPRPPEEPLKPLTLQMPTVGTEEQITQAVHEQLTRAANDLKRIDLGRLDTAARTQYDTATGIIRQANQALSAKNLVFAKSLADKAVALAAQLAGR
jgi:outer membrane biosynthesis protein TonB